MVVGAAVVLVAACGRDPGLATVRYDAADSAILVAALMPACGCLSLANIWDEGGRSEREASGEIEVVASLEGTVTGTVVLGARQEHSEKFDWAGPDAGDRYQIAVYARRPDGSRGDRLRPISRYVRFAEPVSQSCRDSLCPLGPLKLSSALSGVSD